MTKDIIAKRYAKALLSLAGESGTSDEVRGQLGSVAALYDRDRRLQSVFLNPAYGMAEKAKVFKTVAAELGLKETTARFIELLIEKRRFRYIREIASAYSTLLDERQGRVKATVTTADALTDAHLARIKDRVKGMVGKEVELEAEVDPSLIGGVRMRIGSVVYDGSLKNQIEQLKEELLGA